MDLRSHLDTLKEDLVFFDSNNTLVQIVDSIIGVVRPFTAEDERRYEIYLNRSFREYREVLRGLSFADIDRIVNEMRDDIKITNRHLSNILENNYFREDIRRVLNTTLHEGDLDAIERNLEKIFDSSEDRENGLESLDLEDEFEDADLLDSFYQLMYCFW